MIIIYDRKGLCELARINTSTLRNIDLRGHNLENANLIQMDLSGSDLRDVNLLGADLRLANFTDADLRGANLSDALVEGAVFDNARGYRAALPVSVEPSGATGLSNSTTTR